MKHKVQHASASFVLDRILKYLDKNPEKNILRLIETAERLTKGVYPEKYFTSIKQGAKDFDNIYRKLALSILADVDRNDIKTMLLALGLHAGFYGTKTVRENRDKFNINIPWTILFDPTSACNRKCKGCWSAEYGDKQSLTLDEMRSIVSQGKEMGTHNYMMTGGEPLMRKEDVLTLCKENRDCFFLIYTNATLIDQKLCDDIHKAGNITLALSIEGEREYTDFRRGGGSYDKTVSAMKLLRKNKVLFGVSICYTQKNIPSVTNSDFLDFLIENGVKYAWFFNYMPLGKGADTELIPTPEQRKFMYGWMKKMRNSKTGKPLFVVDFQNDGEYVGGCIAGGRNYFHINSAGDIEPCVFIHYSDSNIRTHTLIEALKNPLFMAYRKNQPFNDNHLRPCPMLENPDRLREIIKQTGAKSSDFLSHEDVETLCSKCDPFAKAWKPVAEELWNSAKHPNTHTQYYRDTPEGKKEQEEKVKSTPKKREAKETIEIVSAVVPSNTKKS